MVSAVILAAGRGRRAGIRKQFARIGGSYLYELSLRVFREVGIRDVVLVVPEGVEIERGDVRTVPGGPERMDSVYNGVKAARGEYVLVHDSARANVSPGVVRRVMEAEGDVVVPAIRSPDSVLYGGKYVDRSKVALVQTPQKVRRKLYLEAYERAKRGGRLYTDEGSLIFGEIGIEPTLVEGDRWNFKVTYPEDLDLLRRLKLERRTLFGYDVHRLAAGRPLFLAGVKVSDETGAVGHSDGDAVLHAIVDALLSFMGYGDIGTVFPDTDPRWEGVRSTVFAEEAMALARERGISVSRLDITVIVERPKLGPFREEMVRNLSGLFSVPREEVSLKAKSGNGLYPNRVEVFALIEVTVPIRSPRAGYSGSNPSSGSHRP